MDLRLRREKVRSGDLTVPSFVRRGDLTVPLLQPARRSDNKVATP